MFNTSILGPKDVEISYQTMLSGGCQPYLGDGIRQHSHRNDVLDSVGLKSWYPLWGAQHSLQPGAFPMPHVATG